MTNIISKLFFLAGLIAYGFFLYDRSQSYAVHTYGTDVVAILLLGILAHFAFERRMNA